MPSPWRSSTGRLPNLPCLELLELPKGPRSPADRAAVSRHPTLARVLEH
ncbi:MAG: hypothetical protein AB1938_30050 [Myxococcota bacterium]